MDKAGNTLHLGTQCRSLTLESSLIMKPKIFSQIFTMEVSMYKFINLLISFFTRETVRSIAMEVFVKQSFHNFIFKHGYRCDRLNTKKR